MILKHDKKKGIIRLVNLFLKQERAVAAIEMSFILPIIIILAMGFLEFSFVFSMRTSLEELSRDASRITQAINGNDNTAVTNELHNKIVRIVTSPSDVTLRSFIQSQIDPNKPEFHQIFYVTEMSRTGGTYINTIDTNLQAMVNARQTISTTTFTNRDTPPAALNLGGPNDFVGLEITYNHPYLTPLPELTGLGTNIMMRSVSLFQNENEDDL